MTMLPEVDYQDIFRMMPGALMLVDIDAPRFTIIAENQAHADAAMMPLDKAVGQAFLEAYPDTSPKFKKTGKSDVVESLRKVIKTGQPDPMDVLRYDLQGPDGVMERRYWRATHYPVFGKDKKLRCILQQTANVTDEIIAARKLEEAQRQLSEALAVGMIGTWLWDLKEDYIVADANLLRLFGLTPEQAINGLPLKTFTDSIYEEDRPRVNKIIQETVASQGSFEEEYRTVSQDGSLRWVIARGRVEVEDGKPVRFPGVTVDISERKQAERNLFFLSEVSTAMASSLDYHKTLETIAELAVPSMADWCTIDMLEDGQIVQLAVAHKDPKKVKWAKRLRETTPVKLDDPTGVAAVLRSGKPEFYPLITDEMLVAASTNEQELQLTRSLNLTSVIVVPLLQGRKPVGAITLVSSDQKRRYTEEDLRLAEELASRASMAITNAELYRAAQEENEVRALLEDRLREANEDLEARVHRRTAQLTEANRDLERSNQELQDFAYVASHDLQEPLRKIQAFGNLLEDEYGRELGEGSDYLDRMRNAASRMSILIEDLLSFSRVTTKANPLTKVNLNEVIDEVLEDLEVRIQDTGAVVDVKKLPVIEADRLQMRQLFQNLIGNALKFRRPDIAPKVTVTAKLLKQKGAKADLCELSVRDNGIGFDEKYLDRIFSVFQRLHGKDAYQGTGIGLAICRKIVERHNGQITAKSAVGEGSTFIATLPVTRKAR